MPCMQRAGKKVRKIKDALRQKENGKEKEKEKAKGR